MKPKSTARRRLHLLALPLAVVSIQAAADEDLYFSSLPVVATVSRLPQALADAPGSVTVIDRDLIRASGARSISDLLRLVPGFQVTPPNVDTSRVAYHGLSSENYSPRVQVLIDGRSQYSPLFLGGVNWNILPVAIEDIARIEVVRGSNSAAYGSNAFLGVVNIITLDASQAHGATAMVSYGTGGVRDEFLRWGGRIGSGDFRLSVRQQADDGYGFIPQSPTNPPDIADSFRQRQFDLRADVALTDRDHLQIGLGALESRLDVGRRDQTLNPPRQRDETNRYLHVEWRRTPGPDREVGLRYFHAEEGMDDDFPAYYALPSPLPVMTFSVDMGGRSTRDDLEFQHILKPAEQARVVWGLGARRDSVRNRFLYYSRGEIDRNTYRIFGHLEWRLARAWLANIGGNWEHDSFGGTTFAPRLNLSYQPLPGQTWRLGAARSFRAPSAYEAYGDQRLVPDGPLVLDPPLVPGRLVLPLFARDFLAVRGVKPERIDSFDLGYLAELPAYRFNLDVRAFYERVTDRIVEITRTLTPPDCELNPTDRDWRNPPATPGCGHAEYSANGQRATVRGIESQWRWQPLDGTRLLVNQAFLRISQRQSDSHPPDRKLERQTLASAPLHSSTLMLMQSLPYGIEFSATHHWVGRMRWTYNSSNPAFRRLDLRLAYPFRRDALRGEIAFVSQSADGAHTEFNESLLVAKRHWLTLRLDL